MRYILFFIILISFLSCSLTRDKEIEPNNTRYDAQLINVPIHLQGEIKNNQDIDYYKFIIEQTNIGDIELKTPQANSCELSLYFQNECIKKYYLSQEELDKQVQKIVFKNIYFQKGIYYIHINLKHEIVHDTDYQLNISMDKMDKDIEHEPNDRLVQANYINITNGMCKGFFAPPFNFVLDSESYQESDWFMFNVTQPSNILNVELTSVPDIDSVMELYNNMGYLLKPVDSGGIEESEVLKNFGVSEPGDYYIKIYNKNTPAQNLDVPYQLYLSLNPKSEGFEYESNDSFNFASLIQGKINGYINPIGDKDYFYFNVMSDKSIFNISITPLNYVNLRVDILNSFRENVYTLNSGAINEGEILPNLLLRQGKYFICVSDSSNQKQNYTDYYTLKVNDIGFQPTKEYEPDNSFDEAISISLSQSYNGYIAPKGDMDYFSFSINESKTLRVDVSPVPQIKFKILLYDALRNQIKELIGKSRGDGVTETISFTPGTYYVILMDADNNSNSYENYTISIFER